MTSTTLLVPRSWLLAEPDDKPMTLQLGHRQLSAVANAINQQENTSTSMLMMPLMKIPLLSHPPSHSHSHPLSHSRSHLILITQQLLVPILVVLLRTQRQQVVPKAVINVPPMISTTSSDEETRVLSELPLSACPASE